MLLVNPSTGAEVELPDGLYWSDEFKYSKVAGDETFSITGSQVVFASEKKSGRPITLVGQDSTNWITRAQLEVLQAWLNVPKLKLQLKFQYAADTRQFVVMFAVKELGLEATPVLQYPAPKPTDEFRVIIRLFEFVEEV